MALNCGTFRARERGQLLLTSAVLGMGWLSSVGIAQHLIRELALRAPRLGAGLPLARELRRDAEMPGAERQDGASRFWSVYSRDFDAREVAERKEVLRRVGKFPTWQERLRADFEAWGIPHGEDKASCQSLDRGRAAWGGFGRHSEAGSMGPKKLTQLFNLALYLL